MGNVVAKIMIFSILLNLAAAITMVAVVDENGNSIFDATSRYGFSEDSYAYGDDITNELKESVSPSGSIDDKGDQIYRVLDMLQLGFIYKFMNIFDTYMYGFVNLLNNIFGPVLDDSVSDVLFGKEGNFGALKTLITLSYIFMGIYLLTGKDVVEGS
jgi:hypothetical protein